MCSHKSSSVRGFLTVGVITCPLFLRITYFCHPGLVWQIYGQRLDLFRLREGKYISLQSDAECIVRSEFSGFVVSRTSFTLGKFGGGTGGIAVGVGHTWTRNICWTFKLAGRLKRQLYNTKRVPACAGFKTIDFSLVRAGGLGFCSWDLDVAH